MIEKVGRILLCHKFFFLVIVLIYQRYDFLAENIECSKIMNILCKYLRRLY